MRRLLTSIPAIGSKLSITADCKSPADLSRIKELITEADVVIENFKVGNLAKFGLNYKTLSARNPRLIYCSITGLGQSGPYSHRAAYDLSSRIRPGSCI